MNEVFFKALTERIKAEQMTIEQVPETFRDAVQKILDKEVITNA